MELQNWPDVAGFPPGSLPEKIERLAALPSAWPQREPSERCYAVVMLFVPPHRGNGPAGVVLTRRSVKLRSYKGQIGFAGGRAEPADSNALTTALRELYEELGIPSHLVVPLGQLPRAHASDGSTVFPLVAAAPLVFSDFILAPDEVAELIVEPWTAFRRAESQPFRFTLFGQQRFSHFFSLSSSASAVWGLTAQILYDAGLS